jgi:hypothetical protein
MRQLDHGGRFRLCLRIALLKRRNIRRGSHGTEVLAAKPNVRQQIGQLAQKHERHRDSHDDGPAAAFVDHQRGQPAA